MVERYPPGRKFRLSGEKGKVGEARRKARRDSPGKKILLPGKKGRKVKEVEDGRSNW